MPQKKLHQKSMNLKHKNNKEKSMKPNTSYLGKKINKIYKSLARLIREGRGERDRSRQVAGREGEDTNYHQYKE